MAEDIHGFVGHRQEARVHLIGHSMGAKAVMTAVLDGRLKENLKSMTVLDMAPTTEPIEPQYSQYIVGMMAVEKAQISTREDADRILATYEPDPHIRQFLLTNAVWPKSTGTHVRFRCALDILLKAVEHLGEFPYVPSVPGAPQWAGPTLFLRGGRSIYITEQNLLAARYFFPNSSLETILRADHWVHASAPEETVETICRFLEPQLEAGDGQIP